MRNILRSHHPPRFDLDPVAIALINDLVVKFNKSGNARVFAHVLCVSADDTLVQTNKPIAARAQGGDESA